MNGVAVGQTEQGADAKAAPASDIGCSEASTVVGPDGLFDVQDLIVLAEHLFEEIPPVE
jgi:hypothetical protein